MPDRPAAVLFACNRNRVRSPMAVALTRLRLGEAVRADSAGLEPSEEVDPFAAAVMQELGVDIADHVPKRLDGLSDGGFDLVVALTPEAEAAVGARAEYWPVEDPTLVEGSREQRLDAYRRCRDALDRLIRERLGPSTSPD